MTLGDDGGLDRDTAPPSSTPTVTRLPVPGVLPPPAGAGGTCILTRFSSKVVLGPNTVVIVRRLSYCAMVARVTSTEGPTTTEPGDGPAPRYGDTYPDSPPLLPPQPEGEKLDQHTLVKTPP